jgi:hypothetical protein
VTRTREFLDTFGRGDLDAHGESSESWFLYDDQRAYDAFYS